jgi:hypothetical protein
MLPAGARRGERIRELHPDATRYRCQWDTILDGQEHRVIDLPLDDAKQQDWQTAPLELERIEPDICLSAHLRYRELRARIRRRVRRDGGDEPDLPF